MNNLLERYYCGITQQLRSEVDLINSLFEHRGLQGEGNEAVLRELIRKFIPKRYAVGTGVIIDRNGTPSNQCDIIVYDTLLYPSLLSLTSVHLFPVDIVYATIEVKTTLDSTKAKECLDNIASVRSLDIVTDNWMGLESMRILKGKPERDVSAIGFNKYIATPPVGIIFAYNSKVKQFETFKNWFMPQEEVDTPKYPTLVGCLDQGIVEFPDVSPQAGTEPKGYALPVISDEGKWLLAPDKTEVALHNDLTYPVKSVAGNYVAIDQSRVLLLFLLFLNENLSTKKINPSIRFTETYLTPNTGRCIVV